MKYRRRRSHRTVSAPRTSIKKRYRRRKSSFRSQMLDRQAQRRHQDQGRRQGQQLCTQRKCNRRPCQGTKCRLEVHD
jgi:hypothetical protein